MVLTPRRMAVVGGVIGAVLLVLVGYIAGSVIPKLGTPGDDSPEAGFARDMSDHHAQAVELGMIAFQKASLPEVRTLGGDIAITQQGQIGVMQTWLRDWDLNANSSRTPMAWMRMSQPVKGNLMPGMATQAQMDQLRKATGKNVDILFCQLMLRHHIGGIHMANGVLQLSSDQQVNDLAQTMVANQTGEVKVLRDLLTKLGAAPLAS
jgi:uncharacterized protein (DUF305 family)